MKKLFTLMLAMLCALFVGVSCTPDNGDGNGGVPTPDPEFKITFIQETLSPSFAACTVEPKDETMLYVLPSNQDLEQYAQMMPENDGTNEGKIKAYIEMLAQFGMVYPEMEEVDGQFVCKGPQVEYPREYYRMDGTQEVEIYAAGFSMVYDEATSMPVVTLLTAVEVTKVPFKAYPVVTIAEEAKNQTVGSAAGTTTIDCTLENAIADTEWGFDISADWLSASWADNKLTLNYEANTAPVARKATVSVAYGDYTWFQIDVAQEKDAAAEDITFDIQVVESRFNGFVVNVTPSKKDVRYILSAVTYDEAANLEDEASSSIGRSGLAYFTGDLQNHLIKTNVGMYQWNGTDFNIIAYAVDIKSENDEDWQGNPIVRETVTAVLSSVSSTGKQSVDIAKLPTLQWVTDGMTYNETADRYEMEVVAGSTVVLNYVLTNPVEGGIVKVNGQSLNDSYNVVNGEPVVDMAACTVTFNIDAFDASKRYHYVSPTFVYTNAEGDNWNITTQDLRFNQVEAPAVTELVITPDQIASINKAGSYYLADGTNQVVATESTWLKWAVSGINIEACRAMVSIADGYQGLFQFQGDASNVEKQGFLGNATSNGEVKQVVIEAYSTYATPSFNLYYGDAKLPNDKSKVLDVAQNCVKGESKGMIGNYECFSFTCTFEIPAGNEYFAVRNDSKGATYIKSITVKY